VGYQFDRSSLKTLKAPSGKDIPVVTMGDLGS
jgi:hypothetical protein